MNSFVKMTALCAVCFGVLLAKANRNRILQDSIAVPIVDEGAFEQKAPNWIIVSDVAMDPASTRIKYEKGTGILLHKPGADPATAALSERVAGDIELDLDFMVSSGGDPTLFFLGRYPISLGGDKPGTVEVDGHPDHPAFRVRVPSVDVAKAPGLWQHLKIKYRTVDNKPHFEAIYLNGVLIHQQLYLASETTGGNANTTNPLLSFMCRTGSVAFRNIHYRKLPALTEPEPPADPMAARRFYRVINPIILQPSEQPYLLRSYLMSGGKKRTHTISVGNPNHSHFSYDLKQGALLQVWRGGFVDVTSMWESRGEPQTATPLGAVIELTGRPALAVLETPDEHWPDSIAFDEMQNRGYTIDAGGTPTFRYEFRGMEVADRIFCAKGGVLTRELTVSNASKGANCLIATGTTITSLGKDLYAINDKSYYVRIDRRSGAFVRKTPDGDELIVSIKPNGGRLAYSVIW